LGGRERKAEENEGDREKKVSDGIEGREERKGIVGVRKG
jgi:hypothetical protein